MKDDMELKRALDALPREIEPPAEAWSGVRARITHRRVVSGRRPREFHWPEYFEPKTIRIAAGIAAVGAVLTYAAAGTRAGSEWIYSQWEGPSTSRPPRYPAPRTIRNRIVVLDQPLRAGAEIRTGEQGAAEIHAGNYGWLNLWPRSDARMLSVRGLNQRLELVRGGLVARIKAPPGMFAVETPIGTVTNIGGAFSVYVDEPGNYLAATSGSVLLSNRGVVMRVPQGFHVVVPRGRHAGTPVYRGARDSFLLAVRTFDQQPSDAAALAVALRDARDADAISLWHMLQVAPAAGRAAIYERLAQLAPPPRGVTRARAIAGDAATLDAWWDALPLAPHPRTSLHDRVWLLWLKASSRL